VKSSSSELFKLEDSTCLDPASSRRSNTRKYLEILCLRGFPRKQIAAQSAVSLNLANWCNPPPPPPDRWQPGDAREIVLNFIR
jgi:hypothetical protein